MAEHRILGWNVEAGGRSSYRSESPPTEKKIDQIATTIANINPHIVVVSDAFGWSDESLRQRLLPPGMASYFQPLGDPWLEYTDGPHMNSIGLMVATVAKHLPPEEIDLGTRSGLGVVIEEGRNGLYVAGAYLNHRYESVRHDQLRALIAHLRRVASDMPVVVVGDLNAQVSLRRAAMVEKIRSRLLLAATFPFSLISSDKADWLRELEKRTALEELEQARFVNVAAGNSSPTALAPFPLAWRLDHMYTRGLGEGSFDGYTVHRGARGSDHYPVSATGANL